MEELAACINTDNKSPILRSYCCTECLGATLYSAVFFPTSEFRQYVVGIINNRGLEKHEREILSSGRCLCFMKIHKLYKELLLRDTPAWR